VIGDSIYDLEMARNAGVDAIGVTTGIHSKDILITADPLYIVDSLDDVARIILNGRSQKLA
jgi:phosphoglycolate phosphatase